MGTQKEIHIRHEQIIEYKQPQKESHQPHAQSHSASEFDMLIVGH